MSEPVPKRITDVYARTGDKGVILSATPPIVFEMNQLACEIWELINGIRSTDEIIKEIKFRYPDVQEQIIIEDVSDYIDVLCQNELISIVEEEANAS